MREFTEATWPNQMYFASAKKLISFLHSYSVKFTQKGVITMEISASDKKNPDSTIDNVLFLVSDTGIGVSIRMGYT
jgi:hypothetical protein